ITYAAGSAGQTLKVVYTLISQNEPVYNSANAAIDAVSLGWADVFTPSAGGQPSRDNRIAGNLIGTDWSGTQAVGNGIGVGLGGHSTANLIGGDYPAAGNRIAFNAGPGVEVVGGSTGTRITSELIYSNGGAAIDLGNDGVTANGSAPR